MRHKPLNKKIIKQTRKQREKCIFENSQSVTILKRHYTLRNVTELSALLCIRVLQSILEKILVIVCNSFDVMAQC